MHVDSTFYAFISEVQCWLIKEKESGEYFQCKDSQEAIQEAHGDRMVV